MQKRGLLGMSGGVDSSISAILIQCKDSIRVVFDEPQKNIVPRQSAIFYDGNIVIGGAKIISILK